MPPGLEPADNEPELPEGYDQTALPPSMRAELRSLSKQMAEKVGGHLQAAGELLEIDPELALRHALVARRLASRLPVVREAAAETAYLAGHFDVALTEYRALHRITGDDDYLPIIADCERAAGKYPAALRTLREAREAKLSLPQQVEVILVESGVRDDMGQSDEALRLLKDAISGGHGGRQGQARLRFAYADLLAERGLTEKAVEWLHSAHKYDESGVLDIDDRIAEIKGEPVPDRDGLDEFELLDVEEVQEPLDDPDDEAAAPVAETLADGPERAEEVSPDEAAAQAHGPSISGEADADDVADGEYPDESDADAAAEVDLSDKEQSTDVEAIAGSADSAIVQGETIQNDSSDKADPDEALSNHEAANSSNDAEPVGDDSSDQTEDDREEQ